MPGQRTREQLLATLAPERRAKVEARVQALLDEMDIVPDDRQVALMIEGLIEIPAERFLPSDLTHRGITADVAYDAEDQLFVGYVPSFGDGVQVQGETLADLRAAFVEAVDRRLRD